jgi:hypothetical protein
MSINSKPYNLLGIVGLLLLVLSFLFDSLTMDVLLLKEHYLITLPFVIQCMAVLLFLFWVLYKVASRILLSKALTWIHALSTLLIALFVIGLTYQLYSYFQQDYTHSSWSTVNTIESPDRLITILLLVICTVQVLFCINIIGGLVKRRGEIG